MRRLRKAARLSEIIEKGNDLFDGDLTDQYIWKVSSTLAGYNTADLLWRLLTVTCLSCLSSPDQSSERAIPPDCVGVSCSFFRFEFVRG